MKFRNLLLVAANLLIASSLYAQEDIIVIEGGASKGGLLEATINGDTLPNGDRKNPNRIYELKANSFYLQHAAIVVENPTGTITIRGQKGGAKPVILKQPLNEVNITVNILNSSLVFQNIQYHHVATNSYVEWESFNIKGDNHSVKVEDCFIEGAKIGFQSGGVLKGAKVILRNNYFRDQHDYTQWWAGRAAECKQEIDTLIIENNTFTGSGLLFLSQESLCAYGLINHNTIINNIKYPFLNQYWKELYFTNNLFVNANMAGEDKENVATGGQDPDALLHGIFGVDTIEATINIQDRYLKADGTLTEDVDQISDYVVYAADNVVVNSATLDKYINGSVDGVYPDAPASYLTWGGNPGPFKVVNVPAIWSNERTKAIINDHPNIVDKNNSIYEFRTADLGMKTDPLPQARADQFIKWNRNQWAVPGAVATTPDENKVWAFGDSNPATIPGIETESSKAGGITKFSDMIEDFSYTKSLVSKSDGKRIGSLMWNDETLDSKASLAAIKNAYILATSVKETSLSEFELNCYPNPFNSSTTISFNIPRQTRVKLTVFDISGKIIETLVDKNMSVGRYNVKFAPANASSSIYFYQLTTDEKSVSGKMIMRK